METTEHAPPSFTAVRSSRARWWLAAVALLAGCAHAAAEPLAPPFLRTDDMRLADAVVRGRDHSPTFRAILQRLAASDLIVYLRRGALFGTTAAATQFLTSAGGYRYVRVTLELSPSSDVGVAMLGHELRHALELADAPWVVDETAMASLYHEIGYSSCEGPLRCYDTLSAVDAGRQVLAELRGLHRTA